MGSNSARLPMANQLPFVHLGVQIYALFQFQNGLEMNIYSGLPVQRLDCNLQSLITVNNLENFQAIKPSTSRARSKAPTRQILIPSTFNVLCSNRVKTKRYIKADAKIKSSRKH